jgi:hypothetical protein
MSITWGVYKDQIRRRLLNDETPDGDGNYKWDEDTLKDCLWWALDAFAHHTAYATATSYVAATGTEYTLPENLYDGEPFDTTGTVYYYDSTLVKNYLNPSRYTDWIDPYAQNTGFWTRPSRTLWLASAPGEAYTLHVDYYAYYNHPYIDADLITIPQWALLPVSYLLAAHALTRPALKAGGIAQWRASPDKGTPEHNPVERSQDVFFNIYEREIARTTPQDRINQFRSSF